MTERPEHPASMSRTLRNLEDGLELIARVLTVLPTAWAGLVDAQPGQPKAQSYDGDGAPGSTVICDRHMLDIDQCIKDGAVGCTGRPIPKRSDPTGQSGSTTSRATVDLRLVRRKAEHLHLAALEIHDTLANYLPRKATDAERLATANDDPGCQSCARTETAKGIVRYEPVDCAVKIGDELVPVCRWCRSWVKDVGSLPDRKTLEAHHRGERIKRPA